MLITAIAASPRTPPATLAAIAAHPGISPWTAIELMKNPACPSSALPPAPALPEAAHLTLGTLRPAARAHALTNPTTLWHSIDQYAALTANEIAYAAARTPHLTWRQTFSLAKNPATPHNLAVRAIEALIAAHPNDADQLVTLAAQRGVPLEPERFSAHAYDAYNRALRQPAHHATARVIEHTFLPDIAEAAIAHRGPARTASIGSAIARNMRLPEDLRAKALLDGHIGEPIIHRAMTSLSHHNIEHILTTRERDWHLYANAALRAAPALPTTTIERIAIRVATNYDDPTPHLLLALHPNTPRAHRAQHLATAHTCPAPDPADPDLTTDPRARALKLAAHANAHTTVLDTPIKALRHLEGTSSRALVAHHLTDAITHMHRWTPTPEEALAIHALEPTFPGTAAELITTARAVTS